MRLVAAIGVVIIGVSCADNEVVNPDASIASGRSGIQPRCQLGCIPDPDPNPGQSGVWLGSGFSQAECEEYSDYDLDGFGDLCESYLVDAFRPQMSYWSYDYVEREPAWGATPTDSGRIRIAYLFSYYNDLGSSYPPVDPPHPGDSEKIVVDVWYNPSTQHWITSKLYATQHTHEVAVSVPNGSYPKRYWGTWDIPQRLYSITYPDEQGGHIRVWVSQYKHASYFNPDECESGGQFSADTCDDHDTLVRDYYAPSRNVGSNATRMMDCVEAQNPLHPDYGSGAEECYWTGTTFRGWYPLSAGGDGADPYGPFLVAQGF